MLIAIQEGQYKFLFDQQEELHQFHVKKSRCYYGCKPKIEENQIIKESWNNSKHLETSTSETKNKRLESVHINESNLDIGFRNCLSLHEHKADYYEDNGNYFISKFGCKIDNRTRNDFSNLRNGCKFNATLKEISFQIWDGLNNSQIQLPETIAVDLLCKIKTEGLYEYKYLFNQPMVVEVTSLPIRSSVDRADITVAATVSSLVILTTLILTLSVVVYYKKVVIKKKHVGFSWVPNPIFEPEEDELLPEWLPDNMIFDTSCIHGGKRLGHGNFGEVFEGKIILGNAV